MRKLATAVLGLSALGLSSATSLADDQAQLAEQLLESSFACPVPPISFYEMDSPITSMPRASMSGSGAGFRVVEDARLLFKDDRVLAEAGDRTATPVGNETGRPREARRQTIITAAYGDLAGTEIVNENEGPLLRIKCRTGNQCIHVQGSQDYGAERNYQISDNQKSFRFCDDAALQDAKIAFDTLISKAPQVATRTVKTTVSGGYINMREGPGLNRDVLVQIPAGESIAVDEAKCRQGSDGQTRFPFCPATWRGRKGWVSASGLE